MSTITACNTSPKVAAGIGFAIEGVVLFLVVMAPWAFGSVHPLAHFVLFAGLATTLLLWGLRILVSSQAMIRPCSLTLVLACLCGIAILQLVPLPRETVAGISPETDRLLDKLLPGELESWSGEESQSAVPSSAALSLVPSATRDVCIWLIASLFLFALIRANLHSPGFFFRLALVAVANGVLLSLVGLAQFLSSPHDTVYWHYPTDGQVFGPFICRNHFAYYLNLSMGLGIGLLLNARRIDNEGEVEHGPLDMIQSFLQEPAVLWIGSALTIMGIALLCSLSRGGVVAFLLGTGVCIAVTSWQERRWSGWHIGAFMVLLALGVSTWVASDAVLHRLSSVWKADVLEEGRGPVWGRTLPLVAEFPLLGTGLGTFVFVEPITRGPTDPWDVRHEHVHNDYLEMLIEGGVPFAALALLAFWLVARAGVRARARFRRSWLGAFALGGLFGITAIAVHSSVDFGLHIPAVGLLAIVICASLVNIEQTASRRHQTAATTFQSEQAPRWLTAWAQAALLVPVALFFCDHGLRAEQAERYRLAAVNQSRSLPSNRQVAYLEAALAYRPEDPLLHVALADALHGRAREFAGEPTPLLKRALEHYQRARQLCPLLVQPNLFCSAYVERLARHDEVERYLDRAGFLDPSNPKSWYAVGLHALNANDQDRCWRCWRRSLQCAPNHLKDILLQSRRLLGPEQTLLRVMPDDPKLLYDAYLLLEDERQASAEDRLYLRKSLELLEKRASPPGADFILIARVYARLQSRDAAVESFQRALALQPGNTKWRLELSQFLFDAERYREARAELVFLMSLAPHDSRAKRLYDDVTLRLAEISPAGGGAGQER